MSLRQHWTIAHRTVANGIQALEADSGAEVHEQICEVLAVHGMACISGGPGSIRSIVRSAVRLRGAEVTVTEITRRSRSSVRDLRSRLLESLGLGDDEPRSVAAANVLLLDSLLSPFRVIFVHGAGNAPDECTTFLRWLWESAEMNISVIVEERARARAQGPRPFFASGDGR